MSRAADAFVALLFPQGCHVCGASVGRRADGVACDACWSDARVTPLFEGLARCGRCGLPGAGGCVSCAPDALDAAASAGFYEGALRAALLDLKRRPRACRRLVSSLVGAYDAAPALHAADLAVPVPLHERRLRSRGHNQALALARPLSRALGLELAPFALAREATTSRHRAGLDRAARAASVRNAFRAAPRLVAGRDVLLVDDLFTTGATLGECARALKKAGARSVVALTAARVALSNSRG